MAAVGVLEANMEKDLVSAQAVQAPVQFFGSSCRPVVGYSGYTYLHLPKPRFGRTVVAIPAILAARMARSSLLSRCRLK